MKLSKRIICAVISILMLFACSCSSKGGDYAMKYGSHKAGEALYSYWISTYKTVILNNYNGGVNSDEFWNTELEEGKSYEEYFTDSVIEDVKTRTIALALFDEYGLTLTEAKYKEIDADIEDKIVNVGSKQELNAELAKLNMNVDMLREVYIANAKYDALYDHLFGTSGLQLPTSEEIKSYYEANYVCLKYITLYTGSAPQKDENGGFVYDDDGNIVLNELSDAEKVDKAALVKKIEADTKSGASFESYMEQYSDINYSGYKNGFFVSQDDKSTFGSDIINAAFEMQAGDMRTVADENVTYIIKKYELPSYESLNEDDLKQLESLSKRLTSEKAESFFSEKKQEVVVNSELISRYTIRSVSENSYY